MQYTYLNLARCYIVSCGAFLTVGFDQFMELFGDLNINIGYVVKFILACVFLFGVYKKYKEHLIKTHEAQELRDAQLKEALESVRKYPEYRQQSVLIQQLLESEIQELRDMQKKNNERLAAMEEQNNRRERNKLRDLLLQNYRHYTNLGMNPSQSWTKMEAEAFWELFRDYEDAGGDGYIHTVVQPEMEKLIVVDVGIGKQIELKSNLN